MGKEQNNDFYDKKYMESKEYSKKAVDSIYYPLWSDAMNYIEQLDPEYIIDLGCGPGHMEELISEKEGLRMKRCVGYDFSEVAIDMCRRKIKDERFMFKIVDLTKYDIVADINEMEMGVNNSLAISYEFLEHINDDLLILSRLPKGIKILFSVPSYDAEGHVRYFNSEEDVCLHYSQLLTIEKITSTEVIVNDRKLIIFMCLGYRN